MVHSVEGRLVFAGPRREQPYSYAGTPPGGAPASRGEFRSHSVRIENARPIAGRLDLDVEGVAVVARATGVRDFRDEAQTLALAVGDARSENPSDPIASDLIFPHRKGETYVLTHNSARRCLYASDLQPDEALLIKCGDNDASVARFASHTAFEDPATPPGAPPRRSVEFRPTGFFD